MTALTKNEIEILIGTVAVVILILLFEVVHGA